MTGIYCITNMINKKVYIGQSVNIEQRWKAHRVTAFNKNSSAYNNSLYRAIRKYGLENFTFEVLEKCLIEQLNQQEQFWIKYYKSNNSKYGYNLTAGGQTGKPNSLSSSQVEEIQKLLAFSSLTESEIGQKYNVSQRLISGINLGQYWINEKLIYPLRSIPNHICPDCGKKITSNANKCIKCAHKLQYKTEHPSREELKNKIRKLTFIEVGKYYGVSDNAIRKWCESMNLPKSKRAINKISDEDWIYI